MQPREIPMHFDYGVVNCSVRFAVRGFMFSHLAELFGLQNF